ncbi:aldolase/citrate lyase family protein [Singulisphaera sp. PoT]|uniref:aldolase/citrate lyase family protein n=1 Tax=Singulisphaera sp. PoT TaxID=3411797 RepID=UPI003BF4B3CA
MKTAAVRRLRETLKADRPALGLWVTLESPSITEMAAALGLDWVVVDAEHGHLDWKEIVEHIRAAVRSETVVLVRLAERNAGLIKRALDIGADGVVIPWVESAEQLIEAQRFSRYPPEGLRGIGAERATGWGQCFEEHAREANDHVLVVPIIETARTFEQVPAMSRVDGSEIFFFGPADYSATAGFRGQWEGPGVADQIQAMKDVLRGAGKSCGIVATSEEDITRRVSQGFRMICLGLDAGLLLRSVRSALRVLQRDIQMTTDFVPKPNPTPPKAPLDRPPESMRPDRPEVMNPVGQGKIFEIEPGVVLECQVGTHNEARGLTTGIVTFEPGATLSLHTHAFSESITLLEGKGAVEVEGRLYELEPLDNVVVPKEIAHLVRNSDPDKPAVFHVALASSSPARTILDNVYTPEPQPADSQGKAGAERVNRHATAPRFAAGPNTEFIDFFNKDLVPGIEMSGGYGLFQPGGRLPAHVHDFDESITIVEGLATCIVEGRLYPMSDCSTALQPRGRVHYFINKSDGPMAMIWVYAGPVPERIVVDERNATAEGSPWA